VPGREPIIGIDCKTQTCPTRGRTGLGMFGSLNGGSALAVGGDQRDLGTGVCGCVEIRDEGHDDGSDSRVKAAVVTRCLSPLGTGNDETGFVGRCATSDGVSTELLVAHSALPCGKSLVVRSSTAIAGQINIAFNKFRARLSQPSAPMSVAARSVLMIRVSTRHYSSRQEAHQ
jgi:hypothetical protein